ncbi:class I SAM-dependent methyltransferase [Caulobacter sp. Root487D2Y]|uniref:class I SAM-dependent methyltransferase n=1 Tax=Caulobacter sp. Root487D2Y TaxID=1736547 RepID=UPI000A9E3FD4|nr:class I SAM-dependent methyltransferase [Caulobacter sp. Root487D2Y]
MNERIASRCICCDGDRLRKSPAILMPFVAKRVFDWEPVEITEAWGMKTLRLGMAYPLCNSLQCRDCGALFLDIRFSDAEMSRLYTGYRDAEYTALRERFEPGYAALNTALAERAAYLPEVEAMIAPHLSGPPHVLDWGGDTGLNTPFRGAAASLSVHDISGLSLVEGVAAVDREGLARSRFDLVVCSNVLEHVPAPADLLDDIAEAMSPETLLYLEVPHEAYMIQNAGVEDLAAGKKYWHEHVNFFTETSLRALIARQGLTLVHFEILKTEIYGRTGQLFCMLCRKA